MAEPYKHIYKVDLNQQLVRRDVGILATFDSKANRFGAKLYRDGAEVNASGYTVTGYFIRPDDKTVPIPGTAEGNLVYVDLLPGCYLLDGAFDFSLKIKQGDEELAVLMCFGTVERSRTDATAEGGDVVVTVTNAERLGGKPPEYYLPDAYEELLKMREYHHGEGYDLRPLFDYDIANLATAVRAGDFSKIRVGDYWPITLNGSYTDCGDSTTKTLSNATVIMEVAGIDSYMKFGDTSLTDHHLIMCSRDCLPNATKWRSENSTWYDGTKTNPWCGSAVYATLNDGILPLVASTDIGPYIFAGPNGKGMRFMGEVKVEGVANATGWGWQDRGKLFLPFEREVFGLGVWGEPKYGTGQSVHWPIFTGGLRHVIKGAANDGTRVMWWTAASAANFSTHICAVPAYGTNNYYIASEEFHIPLCFLFA